MSYRIIHIRKRSNAWRKIYVPDEATKRWLRERLRTAAAWVLDRDLHGVQHGFTRGRSPVTNAMAHIGFRYTLTMDLEDAFDSVTVDKIMPMHHLSAKGVEMAFINGAARQGLPTSPIFCNLALSVVDNNIMALRCRGRFGWNFCYTRYADDLAFSFNFHATAGWLLETIPPIITTHGFKLNEAKTKLQCARAGRRMITGVAVDDDGVHVPRSIRRRLRAARHQSKRNPWAKGQARGLSEWSKLQLPAGYQPPVSTATPADSARVIHLSAATMVPVGCFGRKFP